MKSIGLYDAKSNFSSLIAELEETHEPVLLTRHGKVVAQICLPPKPSGAKRGSLKSVNFSIADDFDTTEVGFEEVYCIEEHEAPRVAEAPDLQ